MWSGVLDNGLGVVSISYKYKKEGEGRGG